MAWVSEWWYQVSGTVLYGLQITVIGMGLVFFTLGLVIVSMILLTKLPWLQTREQKEKEQEPVVEPAALTLAEEPASQDDELAEVAAITVAMLSARPKRVRAANAQGGWKRYGRAHQLGL